MRGASKRQTTTSGSSNMCHGGLTLAAWAKVGGAPASVAVTEAEHQVCTNQWRARIPYGDGTVAATRESVIEAARETYRHYPEILRGLGL